MIKWPREYAADIIALRSKEERIKALATVPEDLRALVRAHVVIHFQKIKGAQRMRGK